MESLPPVNSRREMKFYWDSSHFKENVGDLVLDRICAEGNNAALKTQDFGMLLTPDNIEMELARIRTDQKIYRHNHPEEISQIEQWVDAYKKVHNIRD